MCWSSSVNSIAIYASRLFFQWYKFVCACSVHRQHCNFPADTNKDVVRVCHINKREEKLKKRHKCLLLLLLWLLLLLLPLPLYCYDCWAQNANDKKNCFIEFQVHWQSLNAFYFSCSISFLDLVRSSLYFFWISWRKYNRTADFRNWCDEEKWRWWSTNIHIEPLYNIKQLIKQDKNSASWTALSSSLSGVFSCFLFLPYIFVACFFFIKALDLLIIRLLFSLFKKTVMFKSAFLCSSVLWRMSLLLISVNRLEFSVFLLYILHPLHKNQWYRLLRLFWLLPWLFWLLHWTIVRHTLAL